jgi:TRAP-type C4-dicarboxylate transport system substrate-binding protein
MGGKVPKYLVRALLVATLLAGLVIVFAGSASAAAPAKQIVWKMDYWLPLSDPETVKLQQACDDILEMTEGRLKINLFPNFSLKLNPGTQLSNIRDGQAEATCMNVQMAEGQDPSLTVTEAPGVWQSKADQAKAVDALTPFKKKIYADVWKSYLVTSSMFPVQTNGIFSTKKPLKSIADLKGFKLRVPSRRHLVAYSALGAAPLTMPPGEVYNALQQGVLDGLSSGSRTLLSQKLTEVVKYALEGLTAEAVTQDIVINQKAWDTLPNDIKEIVTMVFTALSEKQRVMATMPGVSKHWTRLAEATGIQYVTVSPQDAKKVDEAFAKEWSESLENANPRTKEAWNIIKKFTTLNK